eukprot:1129344-Pelagomonas_calceolata.AAC.1
MNVPTLRRDFGRIKVARSTWDRAHKDIIRETLVSGRGASTIREKQSGIVWEIFSGTSIPCSRRLSFRQASIPIRDEPNLPVLKALTQKLRPT